MNKVLFLLSLGILTWQNVVNATDEMTENGTTPFFQFQQEASKFSTTEQQTNPFPSFEQEKSVNPFEILPADAAFELSVDWENPTLLIAQWEIAEGYYLYRDQFTVTLTGGGLLAEPQFPEGIFKEDSKFGHVEVYEQAMTIKLPIQDTQGLETLTLKIGYQGCAEDRMCYPPMEKIIEVNVLDAMTSPETALPLEKEQLLTPSTEDSPNSSTAWLADSPQNTDTSKGGWLTNKSNQSDKEQTEKAFLKAEEAFIFSAEFPVPDAILLRWKIAEGYYLYRNKLAFSLESEGELGTPQWPLSLLKTDPIFGEVQIYQQPVLEITLPIKTKLKTITLNVKYQGCAIAGLCYPPETKTVELTLGQGQQSNTAMISEQDRLANLLASDHIWYTLIIFFGLGLLLSLTPCVFPMIPILSGIIVGQADKMTTAKAFIMSLIYVLAMAFTYAIVGALTGLLGENLSATFQNPWVLSSFALIFVLLSLSMFGFYELQMPSALQTKLTLLSNRQQGGNLIGVAIMGSLSALIVGPCVAAPLVGALIYIGQTGDALLGFLALFVMSIGMGLPLIIIGTSAGHLLPKADNWMDTIKAIFGVMLLAVAIWMIQRIIPAQITMVLWGSLFIISAIYMNALDHLPAGVSGWRKLWKGLGLILLIYGILLMIGAASGNANPLHPLQNLTIASQNTSLDNPQPAEFKMIKGIKGLEEELAVAKAQQKPVMLDFYADWCISCQELEQFTFSDPKVQSALNNFILLKADVTPNDAQDKALYKHFGIYGPPAILFFDTQGQEQLAYRIVGFMSAKDFHQHLTKVITP
jgi:thioredoxin:protein disulfide reductase